MKILLNFNFNSLCILLVIFKVKKCFAKRADLLALVSATRAVFLLTLSHYRDKQKPTPQHHTQSVAPTGCNSKDSPPSPLRCLIVSESLCPYGLQLARLLCPWNSPVRIPERVAISYFQGSSYPRD